MPSTEVKQNWEAFKKIEDSLKAEHMGQTALLHDGKVIDFYNDRRDAYTAGLRQFGSGKFSIQTVGAKPISLGIHTIGVPSGGSIDANV